MQDVDTLNDLFIVHLQYLSLLMMYMYILSSNFCEGFSCDFV